MGRMMAQVQPLPVGEAETLAARLLREADLSGNADLAIRGIARMLDEALRRIDHLEADTPHVEPPRPRQVLEGWAERGFVPDADGRLREIADVRSEINLR